MFRDPTFDLGAFGVALLLPLRRELVVGACCFLMPRRSIAVPLDVVAVHAGRLRACRVSRHARLSLPARESARRDRVERTFLAWRGCGSGDSRSHGT